MASEPTTSPSTTTIAFFGATGGCALGALVRSLRAGYNCSALARTPSKLTQLLESHGISSEIISSHLVITEGNVKQTSSVETTLTAGVSSGNPRNIIIFGIGGAPKFSPNPLRPTLDDPNVCFDGMDSVLTALETIKTQRGDTYVPPALCAISTTGIAKKRDFPFALIPLYHWLLPVPHADKKRMEEMIEEKGGEQNGLLKTWTIVHPSLLKNGKPIGPEKLRAGYEGRVKTGTNRWGDVEGVAVGYTCTREDVGWWIFEEVVQREATGWERKRVTLTA